MKIIYGKFVNMIGLYNGTGRTEIEFKIDTTKKIILLAGANGSGKTTLLSLLHPFAGTMDGRTKIVLSEQDGYKEIHIEDNDKLYKIEHHYLNKNKTKKTKSFIAIKTDTGWEELNENGNTGTFEKIVEDELDVDQSFFTLARIGSNVESFIDKKPTERKKYISSFLPDIEQYLYHYKKVTTRWTDIRKRITAVTEAINKLDTEEHITTSIANLNNRINAKIDMKETLVADINKSKGIIDSKDPSGTVQDRYKLELSKYSIAKKELDSINRDNLLEYDDIKLAEKDAHEIDITVTKLESKLSQLQDKRKGLVNNISSYNTELSNKERTLDSYTTEGDLSEYKQLLSDSTIKLDEDENDLLNYSNIESSNVSTRLLDSYINNITKIIDSIESTKTQYGLDRLDTILNTRDMGTILSEIKNSNDKFSELTSEINEVDRNITFYKSKESLSDILEQRPDECVVNTCPFIMEALKFENASDMVDTLITKLDRLKDKRSKIEDNISVLDDECKLWNTFNSLYDSFNNNYDNIYSNIILTKDITNQDKFKELFFTTLDKYTDISDYRQVVIIKDSISTLTKDIELFNHKIELLESKTDMIKSLTNDIELLKSKISTENDTLTSIISDINKYDSVYSSNKAKLNNLNNVIIPSLDKIKTSEVSIDNAIKEVKLIKSVIDDIKHQNEIILNKEDSVLIIEDELKPLNEELDTLKYNRERLKEFTANKLILDEDLANVSLVKDALSPTKGIPLLFIDIYLGKTKLIANRLLDIAYNGKFTIDEFDINEKEFKIKVLKDESELGEDISDCSQGETSLTSVALSMALIQQSLRRYNILCLDEIDGVLDGNNRRSFINILETLLDTLGIEQTFIISHNKEFDNHDLGLILMPGHEIDSSNKEYMSNKDIIYVA